MKIQYATFILEHHGNRYHVDMAVQDTDRNNRRAIVTVIDMGIKKIILNQSMSGRQLICPETAKKAIKQAIKERIN